KLLLAQLSTLGVSKKAQSTLSIDEVTRLLDSLQNTQPKAPTTKAAKKSTKSVKKSTKTAAKAAKKKTSSAPVAETPQVISEPEASAVNADAPEADALDSVESQGEVEASATQKLEETPKKKSRKRAVRTGARAQTKKVEDQPDTTQDAQLAGQSDAQPDTQQDTQQDAVSDEPQETTEVAAGEEITTPTRKRSRTRRVVKRTS